MAAPFGGHPSLARYLAWAREENCAVEFGVMTDDSGRPFSITKITAPSGRFVVIAQMDQKEFLVPTSIARLDRRLGLKSPFFSLSDE